jgi:hypothetical protein
MAFWDFIGGLFFRRFCFTLVLPVSLLLILAIVTGSLGVGYGVPGLVWHDDLAKCLTGLVGLAVVWLVTIKVGHLLSRGPTGEEAADRQSGPAAGAAAAGEGSAPAEEAAGQQPGPAEAETADRQPGPAEAPSNYHLYALGISGCIVALAALVMGVPSGLGYLLAKLNKANLTVPEKREEAAFFGSGDLERGLVWLALFLAVAFAVGGGLAMADRYARVALSRLLRALRPGALIPRATKAARAAWDVCTRPARACRDRKAPLPTSWAIFFLVLMAAAVPLTYVLAVAAVERFISGHWFWGGLLTLLCLVSLNPGLTVLFFLTEPQFRWLRPDRGGRRPAEAAGLVTWVALAGVVFYVLGFLCDWAATPVVLIAIPWMGLVTAFGLAALFLSRSAIVFLAVCLVELTVIGGLPPHPYRVAGLDYEKNKILALENETHIDSLLRPAVDLPPKERDGKTDRWPPHDYLLRTHDIDGFLDASGGTEGARVYAKGDKRPLVILCVSGGGSKAALWTLAVLHRIEHELWKERRVHFPSHVRLITGASGGMLGAAYYTVNVIPFGARVRDPANGLEERWKQMKEERDRLGQDFITPLARSIVRYEIPTLFSPWPRTHDRGNILERTWEKQLPGLGRTFEDLRSHEQKGDAPSFVFSPMIVEDGRRLLISNLDLRYVTSNDGNLLNLSGVRTEGNDSEPRNYSIDGVELFRLFPKAGESFRLSTSVRLSASFPFFTPAASIPVWPPRRVVDAGYYDNFGTSIAASWLQSGANEAWLKANVSRKVIIQIRASSTETDRRMNTIDKRVPSPVWRGFLAELTAPPKGLTAMRNASMSFRNDHLLELLSASHNRREGLGLPKHVERAFTVVNFELSLEEGEEVALNWYLNEDEKKRILYCAGWDATGDAPAAQDTEIQLKESSWGKMGAVRKQVDQALADLLKWWDAPDIDQEPPEK